MTQQEIKAKIDELYDLEDKALKERNFSLASKYNNQVRKYLKLSWNIKYEEDLKNGLVWDYEEWITTYRSDFVKTSLEDARQNLLDKIKNLHGVKVNYDGSGVKSITVNAKNKKYTYLIHGHYTSRKTGNFTIKKCLFFNEEYKEYEYEYGYVATLERMK